MTYSFSARGPTKTEAILDVDTKIDKLCQDMLVHEYDRQVLQNNVRNCVNALPDPHHNEEIVITMSGYITWTMTMTGSKRVTTVSSAVCAGIANKP